METFLSKGKPVSDALRNKLKIRIDQLISAGIVPKLSAIIVGDDPASEIYVRNKSKAFKKENCDSQTYNFSADCQEYEIIVFNMHLSR